MRGKGARLELNADYSPEFLFYADDSDPAVVAMTAEAVDDGGGEKVGRAMAVQFERLGTSIRHDADGCVLGNRVGEVYQPVVDDARQGVTDVVRGADLYRSTDVHRLLQALLGLPSPRYMHHKLILDVDGRKLSKSTQATGLRELRSQGMTARDIRRIVGR